MNILVANLRKYLDESRTTIQQLAVTLEYKSPQKIYRLFNTPNASPSCHIIDDLAYKLPDLNLNWLFTGRGNMFTNVNNNEAYKDRCLKCIQERDELQARVDKFV